MKEKKTWKSDTMINYLISEKVSNKSHLPFWKMDWPALIKKKWIEIWYRNPLI
jgi:hypothetical protein